MSLLKDIDLVMRGGDIQWIDHVMTPVSQRDPSSTGGQHGRKSAQSGAQIELPAEGSTQPAPGLQEPAFPAPLACEDRYYEAASTILEDDDQLFSHDNCNELGALIQQWIEDARENWEPR